MLVLADATWTEVADFIAKHPATLALVPVGALEAHGPHLPLATDVIIARGLAQRAAAALAARGLHCALAPAIVYSVTDFARGFAGSAGVGEDAARAQARDVCRGLRAGGFERVCLVNGHLEPAHVFGLRAAAAEAGAALADCTERRFARTLTEEYKRGACHGGSYETSLVLAERAAEVRDSRLGLPAVPIDLAEKMRAGVRTFAEAGADAAYFGDPAAATPAEGEWIFERLVAMVLTVVDERWPGLLG